MSSSSEDSAGKIFDALWFCGLLLVTLGVCIHFGPAFALVTAGGILLVTALIGALR